MAMSLRKFIIPIISVFMFASCMLVACAEPPFDEGGSDHENSGSGVVELPNSPDTESHVHDLKFVPAVAPDCTEAGACEYWACSACGKFYADVSAEHLIASDEITISATGHGYTATVVAPTCADGGYTVYECEACGDSYTDSVVDKLGHDFCEPIDERAPTCVRDGEKIFKCSRCDATAIETSPAIGHVYNETIIASTCTIDGEKRSTCSLCGYSVVERMLSKGHGYTATVVAPTCAEGGYTVHECEACGDSYTDSAVDKLGHDFCEPIVERAPTCVRDGEKIFKCSRCDETRAVVLSATGHTYVKHEVAPTCVMDGYTVHKCSACNDEYTGNIIAALGHGYSSEWSCDDDHHWRDVVCGCSVVAEKLAHDYIDGACGVCGKEQAAFRLEFAQASNGYAVVGISVSPRVAGKSLEIVIPTEHDGQAVVAIADGAFADNKYIKSVYIPSTVYKIGKGAFGGCSVDSVEFEISSGWKSAKTATASTGTNVSWGKPTQIADSLRIQYKSFYLFRV